ncbi:SDR family NAD(P)-dependent oxidoreductase [Rhodococcus opacus]|jgi:NAD(P)-dependent dehydrogenase (short-subunit alcohol dehydrogenase family)|uniref:SDR family NAD(P)-dependent oxidoreductase n=1 Tax=Rhodococcus opacus TaxID=37919 RepID=UPI0011437044|nr:SDR family oxidoreductase [Rhodococcus opacus]MDH6293316.1 NAD(P)-dependent dehydrogenase (short-subunit alcohol dehydrogenase family) [Rhodococcus opacus]TQC42658.1 SDR family oxidoreductase [Rhodococcus sp. WS4]
MSRFDGKVAVVTGGGSGMGEATAKRLAHEHAGVVVGDRNADNGERVVEEIIAAGGRAVYAHTEVADMASVQAMVKTAVGEFGALDLAANVAGIPQQSQPLEETDIDVWDRVNAVNSTGIFNCLRAEIPAMLVAGGGAIVNVLSLAGLTQTRGLSAYVASKHAATGLTRTAAAENLRENIRINGIAPGGVETPMMAGMPKEDRDRFAASMPLGRLGSAEEIANVVTFLLSDEASFVTGVMLPVDGGQLNG